MACSRADRPLETLKGTESSALAAQVHGAVLVDRAIGGIVGVDLPSLREIVVRKADAGSHPALALAGPDAHGRVVFLEEQNKRHALKRIAMDGSGEAELFNREGSGLWGMAAGKHIALANSTGRVAFISSIRLVDRQWRVGRLELFDAGTGAALPIDSTAMSDWGVSWFPDGVRLAITDLIPREQASALAVRALGGVDPYTSPESSRYAQVPAVFVLDTQTGARQLVMPGLNPVVSRDGKSILMWAPTRELVLVSVSDQKAQRVTLPGITDGPYAFVGDSIVLYMGLPTEGAQVGYSSNNSPLVGKKPMRTLKIASIDTGEFQTVAEWVDPRAEVSFGP